MRRVKAGRWRRPQGIAGWLLEKVRGARRERQSLELVERITLGPRQWLALVEADGRRILVATSAEGTPVFYPLERHAREGAQLASIQQARVSW